MAVTSKKTPRTAADRSRDLFDKAMASATEERQRRWAVTEWWRGVVRKLPSKEQIAERERLAAIVAALNEGRTPVTQCACHDAMPLGDATAPTRFRGSIRDERDARDQRTTVAPNVTQSDGEA